MTTSQILWWAAKAIELLGVIYTLYHHDYTGAGLAMLPMILDWYAHRLEQ